MIEQEAGELARTLNRADEISREADGQFFYLKGSARGGAFAKQRLTERLDIGRVAQDGDEEGSVFFDRLPIQAEAEEIRDILGIPKRVELSENQLATLAKHRVPFKPRGDVAK